MLTRNLNCLSLVYKHVKNLTFALKGFSNGLAFKSASFASFKTGEGVAEEDLRLRIFFLITLSDR